MIRLLVKTHNVTGLKYLCKSTRDDYEKYNGSGVYWKNHLSKHGKDISTEVLFQTEDMNEFRKVALEYSKKFDIVNSSNWANLIEENGVGGVTRTSFKPGQTPNNKGKKFPSISLARKKYWDEWRKHNPDYKFKWKKYVPVGYSEEARKSASENITNINNQKVKCSRCGVESNIGNIKRWHNDRCTKS